MFPETPDAAAALSVATRYYSPALLNHCVRSLFEDFPSRLKTSPGGMGGVVVNGPYNEEERR